MDSHFKSFCIALLCLRLVLELEYIFEIKNPAIIKAGENLSILRKLRFAGRRSIKFQSINHGPLP
jgi:hypothetical protein